METSDINSDCLVTDIVHELSSGLEIPFLLDENIRIVNKLDNFSSLETTFYEEPLQKIWAESAHFCFENNCDNTISVKDEFINEFHSCEDKNPILRPHSGNGCHSGSSSESLSEFWTTKVELDTPPITPPDERKSPESLFSLSSDEIKFKPISPESSFQGENKTNKEYKSISKRVRIQPKPVSTTFNIFDTQPVERQTVMCSVFNDVNSINKQIQDVALESTVFVGSNVEKKKLLLSKKDLEILQAKRKQERMIRNRESAYLSRKRKKEHVAHLEKQVQDLENENRQLKLENHRLRQRLANYEEVKPSFGKKNGYLFKDSPKKTTAVLALLLTVCLNIGSFSSFINEKKVFKSKEIITENIVPSYASELRISRSLLWANDLETLNSTFTNFTNISCPVPVNQTESIRLESELRRWIVGDKVYTRPNKFNISKINQYFNLDETPSEHKNTSKHRQRAVKTSSQKKNFKMDMYQMNLLNFNTFFEAIHRRDDTFYLVSFSSDHLLLPALSHNQTSRPKMSLMLPAFLSNSSGADQVEMMQIDCEVTNTQLLSVNENDIPSQMRPYSNSTKNKTEVKGKEFDDYFLSNLPVTLVPNKKKDLTFTNTSNNYAGFHLKTYPFQKTETNLSKIQNFQHARLNSHPGDNFQYLHHTKEANVFLNGSYKDDQNLVNFLSRGGNNLLKLLMVGSTPAKDVKFGGGKTSYKSFKNKAKFLFN